MVIARFAVKACRLVRVELSYGPSPRTWPVSCLRGRAPRPDWCFSLFWEQAALPLGKTARRHRAPRRTHHVLLSYRHVLALERRPFPALLAHFSLPPLSSFLEYRSSFTLLAPGCERSLGELPPFLHSGSVSGGSWYIVSTQKTAADEFFIEMENHMSRALPA